MRARDRARALEPWSPSTMTSASSSLNGRLVDQPGPHSHHRPKHGFVSYCHYAYINYLPHTTFLLSPAWCIESNVGAPSTPGASAVANHPLCHTLHDAALSLVLTTRFRYDGCARLRICAD